MSTLTTIASSDAISASRSVINTNFSTLNTDKAEISGGTFTGDISVPDEAYGVGWNGSVEVPTKNAIYDKIETMGSGGSVATDAIWDAKGDLAGGTGANTASRLAVGSNGQVLTADSAEATGLKWSNPAGGGDMLASTYDPANIAQQVAGLTATQTFSTGVKTFLAGMFGLRNVANTFSGFFTNTNTADRTYTLQNRNGTLADDTDLALKANLASPTFTGTVVLPKTTEIQDTTGDHQYVLAVSELSADRTVTLPLLTGNDEFVFKDHTQTLPNKTLTAPIITTSINAQTGTTYTLVLTDQSKLVTLTNASAIAVTIPTNASVAFPVGTQIDLSQDGAGKVTFSGAGVTINSLSSLKSIGGQYVGATLVKTATDTWNLYGNLIA